MKQLKNQITCFFLLLSVGLKAQLNADFNITNGQGCVPLKTLFANTSTGTSANVTYYWNFGNGNTSVLANPSAIYFTEGSFTVTLTVKDGNQTSTKTRQVTVYKKPTADFNWSASKGCSAFTVTFNSTSIAGDGNLNSYYWDFGDGSTQQAYSSSINHTYQTIQKSSVNLTVTNQYGCYSTITKDDIVETIDPLIADFTVDQTILCKISEQVAFTNKTKGPGTITYLWDFGDGTASTEKDPKHIFTQKGIYTIKLTATSSEGCVNTKTLSNYVNVAAYKADFTLNANEVCLDKLVQVNLTSSPLPSQTIWKMGDGNTFSYLSYYNYNKTGNYEITLINQFGTCTDSIKKNVRIKPVPNMNGFVHTIKNLCGAPTQVDFKDTTATAISWDWNFNFSTGPNITYSTSQNPTYSYSQNDNYYVRLRVKNAEGCQSETFKYVPIHSPSVNVYFSYSSKPYNNGSFCNEVTMRLKYISSEPLSSFKWIFPEDSISTEEEPEFTFKKTGSNIVRFEYITVNGCKGTAYSSIIEINTIPKCDFVSLSGTTICGNSKVFFSTSPNNTNYLYQAWYINGVYAGTSYYNKFDYQFSDTGYFSIKMITIGGGCIDTVVKENYIKVISPTAKISNVRYSCDGNRDEITFIDSSKDGNQWTWDFGDNTGLSYTSHRPEVKHKYNLSGKYKAYLTVSNGSCILKDSVFVYVLKKQAPILSANQTNICEDGKLQYSISNLEDNTFNDVWLDYIFSRIEYEDGSSFTGINSAYNSGIYPIPFSGNLTGLTPGKSQLRIITSSTYLNCKDTTNYIPIQISNTKADFKIISHNLCYQSLVVLEDISTTSNNNKIVSWQWDFGDGTIQTYSQGGTVTHTYANPGGYYVTLKVTDASGCTSSSTSYSRYVQVKGPKASFSPSGTNVPLNTTIYFYNNTNSAFVNSSQYQWSFGDGSNSTDFSPAHTYTAAGTYTITLTATDPQTGCTSSETKTIVVRDFNTAFSFNTSFISNTSCPPVVARFSNTSVGYVKINWDFGDGTTAGNVNYPSHVYTKPGKYFVKLYVYGDNGLKGIYTDSVIVKGVQAGVQFNPLLACASQQIDFKATTTTGSSNYTWDYGDGSIQSSADSFTNHFYKYPGVYKPAILLTNADGCTVPVSSTETIVIDSLSIGIKGIPNQLCNQATINFKGDVYSVGATQSADFLKYKWNFGTGNAADTSAEVNPSFSFNQPGTYTVSFIVSAKSGCYKEVKQTVVVKQSSKGTITGPLDLCPGQSAQFSGAATITNGVQWTWDFKNGQTSSAQNPSAQLFNSAGIYPITLVVNNSGCTDTSVHVVIVHADPVVQVTPANTNLCAGKSIQLNATGGTSYQWTPATGLSNNQIASPIASPSFATNYSVKVTNDYGCSKSSSVQVNVIQPFKLTAVNNYAICTGESVSIGASGASTYKWINNTSGLSNLTSGTVTANPVSTTSYTVVGYDAYGCFTDTANIQVTVNIKPQVNAGKDIESLPGNAIQLNPTGSSDITSWLWSPANYLSCTQCKSPTSSPKTTTTYILKVSTAQNCTATDTITVKVLCNGGQIYIPSAFTPNNDGTNDVFGIMGNGASRIKQFVIYNRWGNKVFEKKNIAIDNPAAFWNGNYHGYEAEPGTYSYYVELVCDATGEIFIRNGTVNLIR